MDKFEMLVDRLREIAKVIGFPRRRTLDQAADMLENQRNEILALRQIIEKQADVNQIATELALELDKVKAPVKHLAYSTLCNLRKDELINYIRELESALDERRKG